MCTYSQTAPISNYKIIEEMLFNLRNLIASLNQQISDIKSFAAGDKLEKKQSDDKKSIHKERKSSQKPSSLTPLISIDNNDDKTITFFDKNLNSRPVINTSKDDQLPTISSIVNEENTSSPLKKNAYKKVKSQENVTSESEWEKVIHKKKRSKPIIGNSNSCGPIKAAPRKGFIHVYRLDPYTTTDNVKKHLLIYQHSILRSIN